MRTCEQRPTGATCVLQNAVCGGGGGVVVAVYNTWLATSGWVCGWQQYTSHETKYPPVKILAAYLFSSLKTSSTSLKLTIFFSFCDLRKISAMDVRMMGTLPGLFNSLLAPTRILKSPKSLLLAHNGRRRSAGNGWSTENRNDSVQQHAAKNAAMRHLSAIVGL